MDINTKGSKTILITLGIILLVFLFVFGISTYYGEKKEDQAEYEVNQEYAEMVAIAQEDSDLCLFSDLNGDDYRLCSRIYEGFKEGFYYDSTSCDYFEPGEQIYIVLDAKKLDALYNPNFTQIYSDLDFDYNQEVINIEGTQSLSRVRGSLTMFDFRDESMSEDEYLSEEGSLMKVVGQVPQEGESFIMLAVAVYPDDTFEVGTGEVILYREAKIFQE
jgi:hypothetical protein